MDLGKVDGHQHPCVLASEPDTVLELSLVRRKLDLLAELLPLQ